MRLERVPPRPVEFCDGQYLDPADPQACRALRIREEVDGWTAMLLLVVVLVSFVGSLYVGGRLMSVPGTLLAGAIFFLPSMLVGGASLVIHLKLSAHADRLPRMREELRGEWARFEDAWRNLSEELRADTEDLARETARIACTGGGEVALGRARKELHRRRVELLALHHAHLRREAAIMAAAGDPWDDFHVERARELRRIYDEQTKELTQE